MAYQAKRTSAYTQDFELVDESGRVVYSMKVALDPGSVVEKLSKQYAELLKTKAKVDRISMPSCTQGDLIKAYDTLGNTVIALIKSVFGEEDTKIILEFYRNRYNDIIIEVLPFITNIVLPDVRRISQKNREDILQKYNRKQKRAMKKNNEVLKRLWDI